MHASHPESTLRSHRAPRAQARPAASARIRAGTLQAIAAGAVLVAGLVPAAQAADTYVGLGLGGSRQALNCQGYAACDRTSTGNFKLFAGVEATEHLGAEVMAWRLGEAQGRVNLAQASGLPSALGTGWAAARTRSQGVALSGVARTQLDAWTFKARFGLGHVEATTNLDTGSVRSSRWAPVWGLGASYALDKSWAVHADWDGVGARNGVLQPRTDLFTVGLSRRF